ncbi:response regulator receiver and ANTAR domain protein [Noviherbaspirillum humi]|uniref:Response regulator receiver and ANTAR domain protein n=1 Tax=Noviherbaspirillum humi TaxID=1688639 RepID=A0A239KCJ5_9BURK|nr:ANTAR domain-containing protein [Noviherbaspirillum humi]SNT15373.1 response regulator receiver and ANTAR domain protein [Noviherbaspirillum humi]
MTDHTSLKIIVINSVVAPRDADQAALEQAERARALRIGLLEAGYNIMAVFPPEADLEKHITDLQPDLIIVDEQSDAALKRVVAATAEARRPIVCFTEDDDRQKMHAAIEAGVSAYVVAGLSAERVKAVLDVAMARFEVEQKLREELNETRLKLAERKVIERAKGLLMERHRCSEDEAYRKLRRLAMDKNLRLSDVAQRMLDVADLLI